MSTVAWAEFLCGPEEDGLDPEVRKLAARVVGRRVPLETTHAAVAARLFNATGCRRRSLVDALIAATAQEADAELATVDRGDFAPFEEGGLRMTEDVRAT
jgi:predicted nucleic acid-binding protein